MGDTESSGLGMRRRWEHPRQFEAIDQFSSCQIKLWRKDNAMIELTEHQRQELSATDPPQVLDPETGKIYMLVHADVYERVKALLEEDFRVIGEMVDRLMEDEDKDDPTLAFYQQRYGHNS